MSGESERIAVIRFSSLGDIVCTGPAVRAIKARFPESTVSYITTEPYADLASALPGVDHVLTIRRRGDGFRQDLKMLAEGESWTKVADLQGSSRSHKLAAILGAQETLTDRPPRLRRAVLLATKIRLGTFIPVPDRMLRTLAPWGVQDDGGSLELKLPDDVVQSITDRFGDQIEQNVVLIPGAKHATKRWPDEYWRKSVKSLNDDEPIVVLGGKGEFPDSLRSVNGREILDLTGSTSILEAAAVLQKARVVVTGDTGPMHMAVAVGAPLVAMFGPTVREFGFYPYRHPKAVILEDERWCRPCSAHGSSRCPLGHHRCMRELTPDRVIAAVHSLVGS